MLIRMSHICKNQQNNHSGSSGTLSLPVSALDLAATPGVRAFALRRGATGARLDPGARRRVVVKVNYEIH